MVLVACERTWTFGLCSLYFIYNVVDMRSVDANKKKEPFFVSDGKVFQKTYRFEDFFWTGSGDGPVTEEFFNNDSVTQLNAVQGSLLEAWRTTTVFHTTTILFATVFPNRDGCTGHDCKPQISPIQTGSIDFSLPTFPSSAAPDISPSPTMKIPQTNTLKLPETFYIRKGTKSGFTPTPEVPATYSANPETNEFVFPRTNLQVLDATTTTVFPEILLNQKYWILTVLRNDNYFPIIEVNSTENKLSSLYRKAFKRRQDKYLGGSGFEDRTERKLSQPVKVHILNVTCIGNDIEIIYSVTVAGKPVPAMTAANDMRLITASEVIAELGYPILTKAEPFMKNLVPLEARVKGRTRDTWLLIGSVIAAVVLLIILAALFAVGLSKKRTSRSATKGTGNKQQVFEEEGASNLGFEEDADLTAKSSTKRTHRGQSKSENSKTTSEVTGTTIKFAEDERRESTTSSSCSGSSEASLVRLRHQQRKNEKNREAKEEKPKPKPRTRIRRIENSDCVTKNKRRGYMQSASSAMSRNTFDEITTEGQDDLVYSPRTRSPTSYLSMPSVRAFPRRTKIPEPLNKILEPTSIRHLDADSDSPIEYSHCSRHQEVEIEQVCEVKNKFVKGKAMTRHASLEGDDPGVIGPIVWNRHCQRIGEGETDSLNVEEAEENVNVGRMRRRFNELLDDALSMFGSRNGSPEGSDVCPVRQMDNRVHSAVVRPAGLSKEEAIANRPKTTGSKRPQSSLISGPRGAWETPSSSTLARPVSAGVFQTSSATIDKNLIYVNSDLTPSDPAIPLIAAIKNELKKFEGPPDCNS